MVAKDILLDEENKVRIEGGDFVVGASDGQHVRLLLMSDKGSWRTEPLLGFGLRKFINAKTDAIRLLRAKKEMRQELVNDGYSVKRISLSDFKNFEIDYERL